MTYSDPPARRRVPRWVLLATSPAALALGLIVGVAASAYGPAPEPVPGQFQVEQQEPEPQEPGQNGDSVGPTQPSESDEPRPGTANQPAAPVAEAVTLLPPPPDDTSHSTATKPASGALSVAEVRSVMDARTVLAAEFATFSAGGKELFHVDYQLARDVNYNTLLVGIVPLAEYDNWIQAVRDYASELNRWLLAAARRVRSAAESEGFVLSWALFEVVPGEPYGFMEDEVTPMPRGEGYLVTRPLATVTDFTGPTVVVASLPGSSPATRPIPGNPYVPVLRFDPTDLYRPQTVTP